MLRLNMVKDVGLYHTSSLRLIAIILRWLGRNAQHNQRQRQDCGFLQVGSIMLRIPGHFCWLFQFTLFFFWLSPKQADYALQFLTYVLCYMLYVLCYMLYVTCYVICYML